MVPNLRCVSQIDSDYEEQGPVHLPKRLLDTPDVILKPVPLRHLLLPNRHTLPGHPHDGDVVHVILVELDLQAGVVTLGPLVQTPALDELLRRVQLQVLSGDVAAEEAELAPLLAPSKTLGGALVKAISLPTSVKVWYSSSAVVRNS